MEKKGGTWKAHAALLLVQIIIGGNNVVMKVALDDGVNEVAFCILRNLIAVSVLSPIAFFCERSKRAQLPLTRHLVGSFFLLGLTGIFGNQLLYLLGLNYTSPTYASAMQPAIPVLTFLLAALTGTEIVNLCKLEGLAKIGGTLICIFGAAFMVAYKGPAVIGKDYVNSSFLVDIDISAASQPELGGWLASMMPPVLRLDSWDLGILCLVGNCLSMSTYFIIQAPLLVKYPATLSMTAYSYLFGSLLLGLSGVFLSNQPGDWSLTTSQIIALLYSGIITSALNYGLLTWANKILGPSLVALYIPLQPLASAILSVIFLGSSIYLGSIIGGILIVIGLYFVTWARYQEKLSAKLVDAESLLR